MATQEPTAATVPTKVCPNCGVQSQTTEDKCPSCGKKYKQKKRGGGCLRIVGIATLAVIAFIVIIAVSTGGSEDATVTPGDGSGNTEESRDEGATAAVGDTVELKGTAYQVTDVKTASSVGGEFNKTQADGVFVIVSLTLTNRKDAPATILEDAVRLVGGNGNEYTTDTDVFAAFDNQLTLLQEIQPDLSKKVVAVYDLPPGATSGAKLKVKDLFSDSKAEIDLGL
jgi:hypothetical protein